MRVLASFAVIGFLATGAAAQAGDACAQTETWFNMAIDARLEGDPKATVQRMMAREMGKDAAGPLVDFVFALPEQQLSPEVGKAARAQCEAL